MDGEKEGDVICTQNGKRVTHEDLIRGLVKKAAIEASLHDVYVASDWACHDCGRDSVMPRCKPCSDKHNSQLKIKYVAARIEGVCVKCAMPTDRALVSRCAHCREARKASDAARKKRVRS
jgi:hypothetical protein